MSRQRPARLNLGAVVIDRLRWQFLQQALELIPNGAVLLDVGCGVKPYEHLFSRRVERHVGLDLPDPIHGSGEVDVESSAETLPFDDASFDVVLITEVLEHLRYPERALAEAHRVLRPSGVLIATTPFLVGLHEEPNDYYRYTDHAIRAMCTGAGFADVRINKLGGVATVISSLALSYPLRMLNRVGKLLRLPEFYSAYNPIVFLLVLVPQWIVYGFERLASRFRTDSGDSRRMPMGYGFTARKP